MSPTQHLALVLIHQQATVPSDAISLLGISEFELILSKPYYKFPETTWSMYHLWPEEPRADDRVANTLSVIKRISRLADWHLLGPNWDAPCVEFDAVLDNRDTPTVDEAILWIHFENVPEYKG